MKVGDLVGARYRIERLAGSGGMGAVYRALDGRTGLPVALKEMTGQSKEAAKRFEREARTLARVDHPYIVKYVDHGITTDGQCFIAMEWLEGESLGQRLSRGSMSLAETLSMARRIATALGSLHKDGTVHRDIKPGNILLGKRRADMAKLVDFGLVRVVDPEHELTQAGSMVGTPGYVSPEQARCSKTVDARADVFALGCVVFKCLTGRLPFEGKDSVAVLVKTMLEDAPRAGELVEIPAAVDRLVARMLSRAPDGRPANGAALAVEIDAIGQPRTSSDPPRRISHPSITDLEQRVLCVLLARPWQSPVAVSTGDVRQAADGGARARVGKEALQAAVDAQGGTAELLAEGSLLVTHADAGGATDQAPRAARSALAIRALLPGAPIALATGWGRLSERWPVGEVVERAVQLLGAPCDGAPPLAIRMNDVTAGLLDGRFETDRDAAGHALRGERQALDPARSLLGKPTPCVGRDRDLTLLGDTWRECCDEPVARVVLVTGPAGVGKSRLRHELVSSIARAPNGAEIWTGRGDALASGAAFGILAPMIRRLAGVLDGEAIDVRRDKLRERVGRHVGRAHCRGWPTPAEADLGRITEFVGELAGVPFPDESSVQLRAARADPVLLGDQMKRAFEELLAAECAAHPVLLVLEDLHFGDRPSVAFVEAALRLLADAPLLVLALARPEVHDVFPRLWLDRAVHEVGLRPLGRRASAELVEATLGSSVTPAVAQRLVERAAGNAFHLEELIRAEAERRDDRMPDTIVAVAQARLERLEPDARRVLRAASVFGQSFQRAGVDVLLGGAGGRDLDGWLHWLTEREVVTCRAVAGGAEPEYSFRHALVREAAYAALTPDDRALGHRLAGDWLERSGAAAAATLAEHFERAGERGRALGCYRRAAEQALEGHDFAACVDRVGRALRCGPQGEALGGLRLLEAEARKWRGETDEAAACALEAMYRLKVGSHAWFVAAGEAAHANGTLGHLNRLTQIAEALRAAIAPTRAQDPGPRDAAAIVAAERLVVQLYARGRYELAASLQAEVEAIAGVLATRDPSVRARILQARAERALVDGDAGEHLRLREACATAFDDAGDARNACHARVNLGYAYLEIGAFAEAIRFLREALATAEHMGLPPVRAVALHNLGLALARQGELADARVSERAAIDSAALQGNLRVEGSARIYMAAILDASGDLEGAEREAREAARLLEASAPGRAYAVATLARVLLARRRTAQALAAASDAMKTLEVLGGIEEGESLVRLAYAEALRATGHVRQAADAIELACERVLSRAEALPRAWRASFLERIPENARTLELAREWLGPGAGGPRPLVATSD